MRLKDISLENRPIERLLYKGADKLSNYELLAIIIKTGTRKQNVLNLANIILSKFELNKLDQISINELQKIKGIGKSKAAQIKAVFELNKRINNFKNKNRSKIFSSRDIYSYLKNDFLNKTQEHLIAVFLDKNNNILSKRTITIGTKDQTLISSKDICYYAIKENADAVIIAHNHPSNDCFPSREDKKETQKLKKSLKLLNIVFLDHLIITNKEYYSFKQENWL